MLQPDFVFRGHQAAVNCVHFLANGRHLVSGDQDGLLIVWNMLLKRQLASMPAAHQAAILAVGSIDSTTIVTQGRDNRLNIWTLDAGEFTGALQLAKSLAIESLNFCKFASCAQWIVGLVEAESGCAFVYNVAQDTRHSFSIERKSATRMGDREDSPMCMHLHANGKLELLVGYESNTLQSFQLQISGDSMAASLLCSAKAPHTEPLMSLDVDRDACRIYTCAADRQVCSFAFDATGISEARPVAVLANPGGSQVRRFQAPPIVAVAGWDYAVHLFDSELQRIQDLRFHRAALTAVDISTKSSEPLPDIADDLVQQRWRAQPQWLAVASRDTRISLWNIQRAAQA
ncbi:Astra associated protein 1 Asa1 [Coemansia sp. RSA 2706]|nr:Astra associated protein 1 Asa1 [Coemansia sp. RSA 2706]KAJ2312662.1 Astra associated protein 1 Asa1 [Coemansia sp. RSA 2704]KAJ2367761.1 Astra associated protein 1 Asa1 [Coemansia sp. RSA 2610]KAJ2392310.1 Astra associated protein 1 Asa1 [Coemansia sp. RSA 2611]